MSLVVVEPSWSRHPILSLTELPMAFCGADTGMWPELGGDHDGRCK